MPKQNELISRNICAKTMSFIEVWTITTSPANYQN